MSDTGALTITTAIPIDCITTGSRLRSLRPAHVSLLAESIQAIGLQNPITVVAARTVDNGALGNGYKLVTGLHRLGACRQLGHETILAFIADMPELDRQLWEIDENLIRAELTELEKADHLARRKDIYLARYPETQRGGDRRSEDFKRTNCPSDPFAVDTAEKLGIDQRTINRSVRRAQKIAPDIKDKIAGTAMADSGSELDALASLEPSEQRQAVRMVEQGKAATVRLARSQIRESQEAAERKDDNALKRDLAQEFAELLLEYIPENKQNDVLAYLADANIKHVIRALRRLGKERRSHDAQVRGQALIEERLQ